LSALGIGLAMRGQASRAERTLIVACALASAGMNYAAADPASWRSVTAFVAAPVFLAVITDRVISVIRRHVLPGDTESAWKWLGRAVLAALRLAGVITLYALRTALAPGQTLRGLRRMVLDAAPVPPIIEMTAESAGRELAAARELPAGVFFRPHGGSTPHLILDHAGQLVLCTGCPQDVPDDDEPPQFASKREAFEWHYRRHPQFGDRQAMSQAAKEIAQKVDLQWGTARTYAAAILAADAMDAARERDEEAQR
jgi:CBS domain-containing protein